MPTHPALCKTTTSTSGTSAYVVSIANNTGSFRTLKQAVADGSLADGDLVHYFCVDNTVTGDASFEEGIGTYTDATNSISRSNANVIDGSNGPGAMVVWGGSGTRDLTLHGIQTNVEKVGIGTNDPQGKLHIFSNDAGAVTPTADTDDLVVENDAAVGISLMAPDNEDQSIMFRTPSSAVIGSVVMDDGSSRLSISTTVAGYIIRLRAGAATTVITLQSNGAVNFEPQATPSSPIKGDTYYDSTSDKLRVYDGASWNDCW